MVDSTEPVTRLPQCKAHTRDCDRPFRIPRDQEISNSVLDTIWNKLLYRRRSVEPDGFETFLREKPAKSFDDLIWFAVSRQGLFARVIRYSEAGFR